MIVTALPNIPMIETGDDLVAIINGGLHEAGITLQNQDVLVVTSKIVAKAEGRKVDLNTVTPSDEAVVLAQETDKDPRVVELVLRESEMVSRKAPHVLVTQHRLGFVSANAGIDQSNVKGGDEQVLLLPVDPDGTARTIRQALQVSHDVEIGVVISDSHGRPFRIGNIGVAIGVSGMPAILDLRGERDLFGRELQVSIQAYADMVASTANLLAGEGGAGYPIVLVRGLQFTRFDGQASDLNRLPEQDLYR